MGYELKIEQTQKPQMTQEIIQAIKILQFNNQELAEYVDNELLENPILEAIKDKTAEETVDFDELKEHLLEINSEGHSSEYAERWDNNHEEFSFERYVSFKLSLIEHLLSQLQFAKLSEEEFGIGRYLIQCIDDNGYITTPIAEIASALSASEESVETVLTTIQGFEPIGIGARTLEESLIIQLKHNGETDERVFEIVRKKLSEIGSNKLAYIAKDMSIPLGLVQEIADKIKKLDPKPGRIFDSDSTVKYVVPDVFVDNDGEGLVVRTNDIGTPQLVISPLYYELKDRDEDSEELRKYLAEKFNSAMWLIRSIDQRKNTIRRVASAIVDYQMDFFRKGNKYLKPLTLKQIGDTVGIHESTVSRAINGKYLQCERGVYEFKYFFSSGLRAEDGQDFSSNSVKEMIREIISREDQSHPLSDLRIADSLAKSGIDISRRTVAKYREAMGIQPSSRRKRY